MMKKSSLTGYRRHHTVMFFSMSVLRSVQRPLKISKLLMWTAAVRVRAVGSGIRMGRLQTAEPGCSLAMMVEMMTIVPMQDIRARIPLLKCTRQSIVD